MSLGIVPKTHRVLDALAGVAIGWYRVRERERPTEVRNPNAHYVMPVDVVRERIKQADVGPLPLSTYPSILWAKEFLRGVDAPHIGDFGGAYGEQFFRFRRYISNLRHTVSEVPEVVARAREIPEAAPVTFTTEPVACDLFFSGGVIMNAHEAVFDAIKATRPPAVIIQSVECTDGPTYWSTVVMRKYGRRCPYVTFNRAEFVGIVSAFGYRLVDVCRQHEGTSGAAGASGAWLNCQRQPDAFAFAFERI